MNLRSCSVILMMILTVLSITAVSADRAVLVLMDDKSVEFQDSNPAILSGDVLVPVRELAETLGATVEYDSATGTVTVHNATDRAVLRLGSQQAQIRGTQVRLPYPPYMYQGRFYAPILFFNEMFDQAWYWDPLRKEFKWIPIFPRWRGGPSRPPTIIYGPGRTTPTTPAQPAPIPATQTVVGELIRPIPSTNPGIVVRADGRTFTYSVARDAVILRGHIGGKASEVELGSLVPGDRVTLNFTDGVATTIRANYRLTSGRVRSTAAGTVLLESGETVRVTDDTQIILPDNTRGHFADIAASSIIAASISPITGRAYIIQLAPNPEAAATTDDGDDQIRLNTAGPLRAGDVLVATFRAEPGGQAWFTIPGASANMAMAEVEPGLYRGEYTVRQGDVVLRQQLKVLFVSPEGETYTRLSRRYITMQTVAGYLPRITSPRQGQEIDSPVVVQGVAAPGSLVRVTIEYRRNVRGLMPVRGTTAIEEVRADASGRWQTPPLSAVAPFSQLYEDIPLDFGIFTDLFRTREEPTPIIVISAAAIGPNGAEQAVYSVEVTMIPGRRLGGQILPSVEREGRLPG